MKHIFLLNTFSLKERTKSIQTRIEEILEQERIDYEIEIINEQHSTKEIVKKYRNQKVILLPVGGDGTINYVLNEMDLLNNILGYIPYGTGNDFYRANKELLTEGIQAIDLGKINDSYFINVVCFGIDADIGNHSDIIHSKWIPKNSRYKISILNHFFHYKPRELKIEIEDKSHEEEYTTVCVCNGRYYGGGYKIAPYSSLTDGLLDIYLVSKTKKLEMISLIAGMKYARHEKSNKTKKFQSNKITIESKKPLECNVDGEILKAKKFQIEMIPKGISIYYNPKLINQIIQKRK